MKKAIFKTIFIIILSISLFVSAYFATRTFDEEGNNIKVEVNYYISYCYGSHYENSGKIYNELLDENVEIWRTKDEVITNAKYAVIFCDMGTSSILDDKIIEFRQIPEDF